ncbi:MAG: hypothetical protein M3112_06430 [Actinomycetia bacterium]|nr:hypothetical protein [Actinomycetes bacterium]
MTVAEHDESYKRSWLAIAVSTVVLMVSYGSLLVAIVSTRSDTPEAATPAFSVGFALVPFVFLTLAFVSGRPNAPVSVLKAMGLWLLVALPLGLFNPVFGLSVGFGIGGAITLKERETDRFIARAAAVLLASTYSVLMLFVIPGLGLLSGGLLPLASLGIADYYTLHRSRTKPNG